MSEMEVGARIADLVLVVHFLFVLFVVVGFLFILFGRFLGWLWIYHRVFRIAHVVAIVFVVVQTYFGQLCPLTIWENSLRLEVGQTGYAGSFIQHWLQRFMYYDAEPWVFGVAYTMFGVLVVATLVWDWRKSDL